MRSTTFSILFALASLASAQTGPGGVGSSTSNVLWLDANSGVSHLLGLVTQWSDRSGNSNHAYLPAAIPLATPFRVTNSVNGYPSLFFDGVVDQLWVNDANNLDLTSWHFFLVVKVTTQKDYNAWLVKGDDDAENYEVLSYSDGNVHTPIRFTNNTRTFNSTAAGQVTTAAFNIIEYSYSTGVGRDVYKNGTNVATDNENLTPKVNNQPLYIGNERSTLGRNLSGDIAEVIAYNAPLNSAQRIIVNNYLAAKYGRTLSAGDVYAQDTPGNGDFDHDVGGIGRVNSTNLQNASKGSGVVQVDKAAYTGLDNDEFLFWGHNNGYLGTFLVNDRPPGVQGRWQRVWRVSEVNAAGTAVDVGNVNMTFDLAGFGAVTASDLRLLVDTDNDGFFADETPISGATAAGGGSYQFSNVSALVNGRRFTLGTINLAQTPLPVELVAFQANPVEASMVQLDWTTASEHENDHFAVERSVDHQSWEEVARVEAIGNSASPTSYSAMDREAYASMLFYRLRQVDVDGACTLSDVVAVRMTEGKEKQPTIFPNPSSGPFTVLLPQGVEGSVSFALFNSIGSSVPLQSRCLAPEQYSVDPGPLPTGSYTLRVHLVDPPQDHSIRILR